MYFHRPITGPLELLHEPPTTARIYAPVKLGKSALLHLADSRPASEPLTPPSPLLHYNVHVLKSNIQKAIRRGAAEAALATAQQLIYQDANEFVRRLPILMTEDTQLVPSLFVECVWLMVAVSKGYVLTMADNALLLTTVASCLAAKGRYNLHAEMAGGALRRASAADTVALAFTLRIAFGGMGGDMAFLGRLQARWCAGELPCAEPAALSTAVEPFTPAKHLLPVAMDFHCFKHMLREVGGGLTKEVVWWHCSSPNFRAPVGIGGADLVATEAQRREETAAEFAAHRDSIAAFQTARLRESCVGVVPAPQFKQASIKDWVTKASAASL
jgi:hypothetical protein